MEEQFNLGCYEDQCEGIGVGQVKETDILSDDDEYCKSVRAASAEPDPLEGEMDGLDLQDKEGNLNEQGEEADEAGQHSGSVDSFASCGVSLSGCATPTLTLAPLKQCAVEGAANKDHDAIWVRRDEFVKGCNRDVF